VHSKIQPDATLGKLWRVFPFGRFSVGVGNLDGGGPRLSGERAKTEEGNGLSKQMDQCRMAAIGQVGLITVSNYRRKIPPSLLLLPAVAIVFKYLKCLCPNSPLSPCVISPRSRQKPDKLQRPSTSSTIPPTCLYPSSCLNGGYRLEVLHSCLWINGPLFFLSFPLFVRWLIERRLLEG